MKRQRKTHTITHAMTCKSYPGQVLALPATLQDLTVQARAASSAPCSCEALFTARRVSREHVGEARSAQTSELPNSRNEESCWLSKRQRFRSRTCKTKNLADCPRGNDSYFKVCRRRVWVRLNSRTPELPYKLSRVPRRLPPPALVAHLAEAGRCIDTGANKRISHTYMQLNSRFQYTRLEIQMTCPWRAGGAANETLTPPPRKQHMLGQLGLATYDGTQPLEER